MSAAITRKNPACKNTSRRGLSFMKSAVINIKIHFIVNYQIYFTARKPKLYVTFMLSFILNEALNPFEDVVVFAAQGFWDYNLIFEADLPS